MNAQTISKLQTLLSGAGKRLRQNEPMSRHTSFRIGGPADLFFEPLNITEITDCMQFCQNLAIPLYVCGQGSNMLVADRGIRGVVMALTDEFSGIEITAAETEGEFLFAVRSGTRLSTLATRAAQECCTGLEFASGIPGTLGGAVYMNAGAYEGCMANVVMQTKALTLAGEMVTISGEDHRFGYRQSIFSRKPHVIVSSTLRLAAAEYRSICEKMRKLTLQRQTKQPLEYASAGSAFKRPTDAYAGKLIADCGLKGHRIGDAQVSEKHAGFIINRGEATAREVRDLFEHVQTTVLRQTGIELIPEVQFIGDW